MTDFMHQFPHLSFPVFAATTQAQRSSSSLASSSSALLSAQSMATQSSTHRADADFVWQSIRANEQPSSSSSLALPFQQPLNSESMVKADHQTMSVNAALKNSQPFQFVNFDSNVTSSSQQVQGVTLATTSAASTFATDPSSHTSSTTATPSLSQPASSPSISSTIQLTGRLAAASLPSARNHNGAGKLSSRRPNTSAGPDSARYRTGVKDDKQKSVCIFFNRSPSFKFDFISLLTLNRDCFSRLRFSLFVFNFFPRLHLHRIECALPNRVHSIPVI